MSSFDPPETSIPFQVWEQYLVWPLAAALTAATCCLVTQPEAEGEQGGLAGSSGPPSCQLVFTGFQPAITPS